MKKEAKLVHFSPKQHHDIKRVARKLKISSNEVIRRRIKSFDEMLKELEEDMKHADVIDLDKI